MYQFEDYYTAAYQQVMLEQRKDKYIEGREKQLLFENAQTKLQEDGLRRLEGEVVGNDPLLLLASQKRSLTGPETFQDLPLEVYFFFIIVG